MAYTHTEVTINSSTSTQLIATGWASLYIQNNSPSRVRIKIAATPTNALGIRIMPNATLPLPIAAETAVGAVNAILEEPGAGDVVIDILNFT